MLRTIRLIFILALAGLVAGGGVFVWVKDLANAHGPHDLDTLVFIEAGMGVASIAKRLTEEGLIDKPLVLRAWAKFTQQDTRLKAGEYEIPAKASITAVLAILETGKTYAHKMTIPEGLNTTQILILIQDAKGLVGDITYVPDEGLMLPETYHYERGEARDNIVKRMVNDMQDLVARQWQVRPPNFILKSPKDLLTLASIIEKETGLADERRKVAAVFLNRLKLGMRLQSDPTVVYALTLEDGGGALGRSLTRKDLKFDSPFNTYRVKGLPPGPIANPGRASVLSVLNPDDTDALYFVADGDGGHAFARTLKSHNRNVAKWRKLNKTKP